MISHPFFVTFEGVEGSGKSTQAQLLYERLLTQGRPAVLTHEPGGTLLGEQVRRLLLDDAGASLSPRSELLLFAAARAQLMAEVVEPGLQRGDVVICDRFSESSLAYQGYARGLPMETVRAASALATGNRQSDLVVLLDLPAAVGLARKGEPDRNRFEREELLFHERVREGYLEMAAADAHRWLVVDAVLAPERAAQLVWERITATVEA